MIDLSKNQNPYYPTKKIYRKLKKEVKSIKFCTWNLRFKSEN